MSVLEKYQYVKEPPERLRCLVCYDLPEVPLQHEECGKVFCEVCIRKNGDRPCPNCRQTGKNYFKDKRCAQEIAELKVACSNKENGCPWEGTADMFESHTKSCTFIPVSCPNKCEPAKKLLKENLIRHLSECPRRFYQCMGCGDVGIYEDIIGLHYQECLDQKCPVNEIACRHRCAKLVKCGKMEEHSRIHCTPERIPCKTTASEFATATTTGVSTKPEEKSYNMQIITQEPDVLMSGESAVLQLSEYSKLKGEQCSFYSVVCYSKDQHRLMVVVDCNGTGTGKGEYLSVTLLQLKGGQDCKLHDLVQATITVTLLNQLSDSWHHEQTVHLAYPYLTTTKEPLSATIDRFISNRELMQGLAGSVQYLVNDTLKFKVKVVVSEDYTATSMANQMPCTKEFLPGLQDQASDDRFTFKISNYSAEEKYLSEFPLNNGYGVAIILITGVHHLSVEVQIKSTKGRLHFLLIPFKKEIQVELLNQLEDKNHYSKVLHIASEDGGAVTTMPTKFIHWTKLPLTNSKHGNTLYLVKDSMFFRVTLGTRKRHRLKQKASEQVAFKHWLEYMNECHAGLMHTDQNS